MKTKTLLTVFLLMIIGEGNAQTSIYHPMPDSNAVWNIYFDYAFCMTKAFYSITIAGDTLISGQNYHKLNTPYVKVVTAGCWSMIPTVGYKGAYREDKANKKVFFVPPFSSSEQLLYDFNMQVGDTVKGYFQNPSIPSVDIVQAMDSVLVAAKYHKRWKINSCYTIYFIEGVGSTYGLINKSPACLTDQPFFTLDCFSKDGLPAYPYSATGCALITSSPDGPEDHNTHVEISPNPFFSETILKSGNMLVNADLVIYNSFGQAVQEMNSLSGQEVRLYRGNLPGGLYFVRLIQNNISIAAAKFIIHN